MTLAGSRFLIGAEKNYVPIVGEALAIVWALEQTRYFTLGCENLIVATDHKPLVPILGDKDLVQINSPSLFRLKQRTLWWSFKMIYLPGKTNLASDATSRYPSPNGTLASINEVQTSAKSLSLNPSPQGELSDEDFQDIALVSSIERKASICNPILCISTKPWIS